MMSLPVKQLYTRHIIIDTEISILLNKLWPIGITGTLWAWFREYLTNRYQCVCIIIIIIIYYQFSQVCPRAVFLAPYST